MDLTQFSPRRAADRPRELHLKHPATGEPLFDGGEPVTITLLGSESRAMRDKVRELERRKLDGEEITPELEGAEKLAALIVGWKGIGLGSDDDLPYSPENARRLAENEHAMWIVEQIAPFVSARRNFFMAPPAGEKP